MALQALTQTKNLQLAEIAEDARANNLPAVCRRSLLLVRIALFCSFTATMST